MEGSNSGRESRRNDSISSVMSFTTESPAWTRSSDQDSDEDSTGSDPAPTTPRANDKRAARAKRSRHYHARKAEHDNHALAHREQPQRSITPSSTKTCNVGSTRPCPETTQYTDMEIKNSVIYLLEQLHGDEDLVHSFQRASELPPVTPESLAELEMSRIINNPKLRHDVNFDKELHFRPNHEGARGKSKLQAADEYWKALVAELKLYRAIGESHLQCQDEDKSIMLSRMMKASQIRMPGMFDAIKTILKTLIPARDQVLVDERLDTPMIMQQISNGAFDLKDLASWLSTLLKAHCAPMRDSLVDLMAEQTRQGMDGGNQSLIVLGLRTMLDILEAMKLDVANHQIRHLRGPLIEDTVNFQQRYYLARLQRGRLEVRRSRMWYKREALHLLACDPNVSPLEIFSSAILRSLLSPNVHSVFPETFQLDMERTRALRSDVCSFIRLQLCCDLFDHLMLGRHASQTVQEQDRSALRASISDIVGTSRRFMQSTGNIAVEIVRSILTLEGAAVYYDSTLAEFVETQLQRDLQVTSPAFSIRVQNMMDETLPVLFKSIKRNIRLTPLALHDAMLSTAQTNPTLHLGPTPTPNLDLAHQAMQDIIRRTTHLGVINWQVWSPIVYLVQEEEEPPFSAPSNGMTPGPSTAIEDQNTHMVASVSASDQQAQNMGFLGQSSEPSEPSLLGGRPPR